MLLSEPFGGVIPGARGAALAVLLRTDVPLTGRRVHELTAGGHSLGAVQQALHGWVRLGIVTSQTAGRASLYSIVEDHGTIPALRLLVDPWRVLQQTIEAETTSQVSAVLLFGSYATGTATEDSDIDLAVIADEQWDGQFNLQDKVQAITGNACDVLVFTPDRFVALAQNEEPVVAEILRDGVALVGNKPRIPMEAVK
jgi:predicted nucleotidyltransferase